MVFVKNWAGSIIANAVTFCLKLFIYEIQHNSKIRNNFAYLLHLCRNNLAIPTNCAIRIRCSFSSIFDISPQCNKALLLNFIFTLSFLF